MHPSSSRCDDGDGSDNDDDGTDDGMGDMVV